MQHHRAARRLLGSIALVLTLTACDPRTYAALTPEQRTAVDRHLAEEHERYGSTPRAAVVQAFTDAGIPEQANAAWLVAAGPTDGCDNGESTGNPTARNGVHVGLFQLSGTYHRARAQRLGFTWEQVSTQAYPNARVAADLVLEQGWRPWSCRP